MTWWQFVLIVLAVRLLEDRLPSVAWGSSKSDHPGWWLVKHKRNYLRALGAGAGR